MDVWHTSFVTDFWSTAVFDPSNFLKRNRLIDGLSEATIVIESDLVILLLGIIYSRAYWRFTNTRPFVKQINWDLETKPKPIQKALFIDLESDEQIVYDFLKKEGKTLLDLIALNCEIPTSKAAYLLLNLELKGVVRPLPGKEFELI